MCQHTEDSQQLQNLKLFYNFFKMEIWLFFEKLCLHTLAVNLSLFVLISGACVEIYVFNADSLCWPKYEFDP